MPDTADGPAWLSSPGPAFTPMSREEYEARREALAPFLRASRAKCKAQEARIIALLKAPGLSHKDKRHLKNALASIRGGLATVLAQFSDWGVTLEPEQGEGGGDPPVGPAPLA